MGGWLKGGHWCGSNLAALQGARSQTLTHADVCVESREPAPHLALQVLGKLEGGPQVGAIQGEADGTGLRAEPTTTGAHVRVAGPRRPQRA